jgi:hypothetical protein
MKPFVLTILLVAACGGSGSQLIDAPAHDDEGCSFTFTEVVPEPPPADLLDQVRACEAAATDCGPLCRTLHDRRFLNPTDIIDSCVVDHAPAMHTVHVGYHLTCAD